MGQDWLTIIEAAYRLDLDDEDWLAWMLEAARPQLDSGLGAAALLYDASSMTALVPLRFLLRWAPEEMGAGTCMGLIEQGTPDREFIAGTFGASICGLLSESFGRRFPAVMEHNRRQGVVDMLSINAVDPSLCGMLLNGHLARSTRPSAHTRAMWNRVAAHLAAAYRLRRSLASAHKEAPLEAVLQPSGKLVHAEGPAKEGEAPAALRESVLRLEKARGKMRREEPERAIDTWKGLVDARWTLLDQFESDGRRYVVARCNQAATAPQKLLSARERQVVAHIALGHSDKQVAYELGLAASTVRVLLGRAAKKLGAHSRLDLIQAFRNCSPG